uniref:Methyltransferase type 11 domain-containing protein n=1 Tax=Astyanax mexicanus TaxID=7994 RepID=A0A3B1IVN8_ASTMX
KFFKAHKTCLEENAVKTEPDPTRRDGSGAGATDRCSASQYANGPQGKLLGVDVSEYMHQMALERMQEQILVGKVNVDKVFHCNCYYFWPDLQRAAAEIHRVMKPGGLMVTTLRELATGGVLCRARWKVGGFTGVRMENRKHKLIPYEAIYATAAK